MDRQKKWNEFLEELQECALKNREETVEYQFYLHRMEDMYQMMVDHLTGDQKQMMEEVLFEVGLQGEREGRWLYRQGMEDCVWLLRHMGVLA